MPYFYRKMYKTKFRGDDSKIYQIFGVPIGNVKITRKVQFHPASPVIKFHQNTSNSCFWVVWHQTFTVYGTTGLYLPL